MPKRRFAKGKVFHVFHKSIEGRNIFPSKEDKWRLLQALYFFNDTKKYNIFHELDKESGKEGFDIIKSHWKKNGKKKKQLVSIISYSLKRDCFHLIIEEIAMGGISKFMHKVGTGYTRHFNIKYSRQGPLFLGNFKAVEVVSKKQLKHLLVYVNVISPGQEIEKELKLKKKAVEPEKILDFSQDFLWGAHKEYINRREPIIICKKGIKKVFPSPKEYISFTRDVVYGREEAESEINYLYG